MSQRPLSTTSIRGFRRPMHVLLALGGVGAGSTSAASVPVGRITVGWPVPAPVDSTLHVGTDGGPVLLSNGVGNSVAASWTPTGGRRWINTFAWGCGNCASPQPDASLPGGPYGPIGPWGVHRVSASGTTVLATAVLTNGTRISTGSNHSPSPSNVTTATRGGITLWSREDPNFVDNFDLSGGFVVSDGTSLYRGFGLTSMPTIALNPANGLELWRVANAKPLAPYGSGVIVQRASGDLAGYDAAGVKQFQVTGAALRPSAPTPLVDLAHRRLYVNTPTGVNAYDTTTGALAWTRLNATAFSVTPGGLVLTAIALGVRPALQAIGPDGVGRWRYETPTPVRSAVRLLDGTIALTVRGLSGGGLLVRMNPASAPLVPRSANVALTRTTFRAECYDWATSCGVSASRGTMLRIASRSRTTASIRILATNGTIEIPWSRISVPLGTSFIPISAYPNAGRIQVRRGTTGPIILDRRVTVTS